MSLATSRDYLYDPLPRNQFRIHNSVSSSCGPLHTRLMSGTHTYVYANLQIHSFLFYLKRVYIHIITIVKKRNFFDDEYVMGL